MKPAFKYSLTSPASLLTLALTFVSASADIDPASPIVDALKAADVAVQKIVAVPDAQRTFENTVLALDDMLAVLQRVVDDYQTASDWRAADRKALREAEAYVTSTDRSWPFSFENLCEAIGLDAGRLRQALERTPPTR